MNDLDAAKSLLSAKAVRQRAQSVYARGLAGQLQHFSLDPDKLAGAAEIVATLTRSRYPDLNVPFHARWRHIEAGGHDRWGAIAAALDPQDARAYGRAAFDLAIVSVLLDAGAGADWRFEETATGETWSRSEGLAVASVDMFRSGVFSSLPLDPFRADAAALAALGADELAAGFQVSDSNPLVGLEGRCELLRTLGRTVGMNPDLFALEDEPRPGGLFDALVARASVGGAVTAEQILALVLEGLGPIWPGRITLGGLPLGDTWPCPAVRTDDRTNGLLPLHKLSQWLSYSLIEPLQWAGVEVTEIGGLTGLAEYRNGGFFMDTGVLTLKNPDDAARRHKPGDPLIVEWRALTVALLDEIADPVRRLLGVSAEDFPLSRVLEGGTWAAGRQLARQYRAGGEPPLSIDSDGTVF